MDPEHDSERAAFLRSGRVDIQVETVFAVRRRTDAVVVCVDSLLAQRREPGRGPDTLPGGCWLRRAPAQISDWRRGVRYAFEGDHALVGCAGELAAFDTH